MNPKLAIATAILAFATLSCAVQAQDKKGTSPPTTKSQPAQKAPAKSEPEPQGSAEKNHALQGEWKVYWIADDRTTQMNVVSAVQTQTGLTNFIGALGTIGGEGCPITGTVVNSLNGQFAEGIEVRTLAILSYVVARANCQQEQVWLEAFGLPSGKVLMSGRVTFVAGDGKRRYLAVALGR